LNGQIKNDGNLKYSLTKTSVADKIMTDFVWIY